MTTHALSVDRVAKVLCALRWRDRGERITEEFLEARWKAAPFKDDYRAEARIVVRLLSASPPIGTTKDGR